MFGRWWAYAVLAVIVAGAVWWGMRPSVGKEPVDMALDRPVVPPPVSQRGMSGSEAPASSATAATKPTSNPRFQLFRVVLPPAQAPGQAAQALIAVDNLPPRMYRVGDAVVGAVVLQSVQADSAMLGPADGPAAVVLAIAPAMPSSSARDEAAQQPNTGATGEPDIRPASAPAVNRAAVPVTDPDHGADTSNH